MTRVCGQETRSKRGRRSVIVMMRSLLRLPSLVADYTVGTVIVLVQMTIKQDRRSL